MRNPFPATIRVAVTLATRNTTQDVSVKRSARQNAWQLRSVLGDGFLFDMARTATHAEIAERLNRHYADLHYRRVNGGSQR